MREQLLNLLELQACDVKVRELDNAAKQLPAKLDPLRRDLTKLKGMLDAERAKLAETDTWRKSQQEMLDRERDIYAAQLRAEGKPEELVERIVKGKMEKFYEEHVLLEQPYVRDDKKTVGEMVQEAIGRLGENIVVRRFQRFALGGE